MNALRAFSVIFLILAFWRIFHIARHTFATTVTLANNVPLEVVSKMLGHTDIKTTQIYAKVLNSSIGEHMRNVSEKIK